MGEVTLFAALTAGLLSFVSPCVLPLVPAYISFMTGITVENLRAGGAETPDRWRQGVRAGLVSLAFVLGFSLVFIALGASAFFLGRLLMGWMGILSKVGGALVVLFGLHYMGVFRIGFLNLEARFNLERKPPGLWGAFLVGVAFSFGWTPCVGPILATILTVAGAQETLSQGVMLLVIYSAGLGIPFLVAGVGINLFFAFYVRMRRWMHTVERVSGGLMVLVGLLIFFGNLGQLSSFLLQWFPGLASIG
ncbi:MAG: cytochrome c biogenesis protein CcdA [Magnetococcales bacterium]|nr:cytochrome c biogenesis protein CcdA [Magnetococcales bacterium]